MTLEQILSGLSAISQLVNVVGKEHEKWRAAAQAAGATDEQIAESEERWMHTFLQPPPTRRSR